MHAEIYDQIKADMTADGFSQLKISDSTRGVFPEGGPAFKGSAIFEKSHIQICIRNPNVIQGFFMPGKEIDFMRWMEVQEPSRTMTTAFRNRLLR